MDHGSDCFKCKRFNSPYFTKVCCILAGMSLLLFLSRLCFRPPGKLQSLLAGIFGAPVGALATVQAGHWVTMVTRAKNPKCHLKMT